MRFRPRILAACAVCLLAFGVLPVGAQRSERYLRVSFIDVGQGDAIWIQGPAQDDGGPGGSLIIDGGPDRGADNRLLKYLRAPAYGLPASRTIDCVVATHPHDDHYPGLIDVLENFEVRQIVDSGYPKDRTTNTGDASRFEQFRQLAMRERAGGRPSRFIELRRTAQRELQCGNLRPRILSADSAALEGMGSGNTRENNASIVLQLKFGAFTFLFMGDAEGKDRDQTAETTRYVEELLLKKAAQEPNLLRADVLKAGHHGSETGSTLKFIRAVQPSVIVVMSGRRKFNGEFIPDQTVLNRYRRENPGVVVLRTDEDDARQRRDTTNDQDGDDIYMYTDGESLRVFRAVTSGGRRLWSRVTTIQKDAP